VSGSPSPSGLDQQYDVTGRRLWVILSALMLTMLLAALDQTIVSTALPTITSDLGGLDELSWVVTAYLLASTSTTPLWGKASDLYGRKLMLQSSVVVFLIGSAAAGLSQNMGQLIATRALQGVGAGGLMVLVLAVIADLVPPRERGRYSGLFGAVFGVASVVGPLLGGLFTQHLSWRWVFYVNVPLGIAAFVVLGSVLHIPARRRRHRIDWPGASLLVTGVVFLLLVTVWGGQRYPWVSAPILGLLALGGLALALLVWQELRHPEPIIDLALFRSGVMRVTSGIGFVIGFGMFGSIVYLSIYLQVVRGASPTSAGLQLLPLMAGVLVTSVLSGRLVTRYGRYRVFPIVGTGTATVGMFLLSQMGAHAPFWLLALSAFILGAGIGGVLQVLVISVQNSVDPKQVGSATSISMFFRSIGGAFGTAAFGAFWAAQLTRQLSLAADGLPPAVSERVRGSGTEIASSMTGIRELPDPAREAVMSAITVSIDRTFLYAVPVMAVAFVLSFFLPEVELRTHQSPVAQAEADLAGDAASPLP